MTKKEFYQLFVANAAQWLTEMDEQAYFDKHNYAPVNDLLDMARIAWQYIEVRCDEENEEEEAEQ